MLNKNNLLRFLIVVLFLSSIAIATETTWRHSGFEISGFDINGSSTYNLTEIRKIEFGWNTSVPAVSETSRAVMYYDDNQKRIMQSVNGGAYQAIVDNTTVNAYTVNAANATGVLPNASIPASAMNLSSLVGIVKLHNSSNQIIPSSVYTQINLNIEDFDGNNECAANQCVIPVTGKYHVIGTIYWDGAASKEYITTVYKNGVATEYGVATTGTSVANGVTTTLSTYLDLNAGDTLKQYGYTTQDNAIVYASGTFLMYNIVRKT